MAITEEQRAQIIALLREGVLRNAEIAVKVGGVSPGTVSAMRSHLTMGSYDQQAAAMASDALEQVIEAEEVTFGLERDLQAALRANIEQLEPDLVILDGGKERTTEAGRVDIMARDPDGVIVVIELKAGAAAPDALTQLLAYMGVIEQEESTPVRGILVAGGFHQRVVYAALAVPNVSLRRYRFKFTFERA
ncbi:MAG: DUF91 domain-containing protein [Truepera sp.]|nr:DUF91 domain-containing protein [Truepera sp.]